MLRAEKLGVVAIWDFCRVIFYRFYHGDLLLICIGDYTTQLYVRIMIKTICAIGSKTPPFFHNKRGMGLTVRRLPWLLWESARQLCKSAAEGKEANERSFDLFMVTFHVRALSGIEQDANCRSDYANCRSDYASQMTLY